MKLPLSIPQARTNILQQGIQQTNRYALSYNGGELKYPFAISLPAYGYDLIDHSLWSIIRKIPFRRTHSDLEVTFIVGNFNYGEYVYYWNNLITSPKKGLQGGPLLNETSKSDAFAAESGISPTDTSNGGGLPSTIDNAVNPYNGATPGENILSQNTKGIVYGSGGAVNYIENFFSSTLNVFLLDENHQTRNTFTFDEVYVSQISTVDLTSTETGYSPFKVSFRFTTMSTA